MDSLRKREKRMKVSSFDEELIHHKVVDSTFVNVKIYL